MNRARLAARLAKHEGERLKPYVDTVGKTSIGIGRNLDDVGISHAESWVLFQNDIDRAIASMPNKGWFKRCNAARQEVLVEMCFNLGAWRLKHFKKMWTAISASYFEHAADEMLDSLWARQVGKKPGQRAHTLSEIMRTGEANE